jgi:hypothetical protein
MLPGFKSTSLQGQLATTVPTSVIFQRSGNVSNSYLQIGSVVSDATGFPIRINDGELSFISVQNENVNTFDVSVYEWDGTTETLLSTVSVVSSEGSDFTPSTPIALTFGNSLRARVTSGSCKNPVLLVYIIGDVPA